jgi:hypothetical protein
MKEEVCENCGRVIASGEQACLFQNHILCEKCDVLLRQKGNKSAGRVIGIIIAGIMVLYAIFGLVKWDIYDKPKPWVIPESADEKIYVPESVPGGGKEIIFPGHKESIVQPPPGSKKGWIGILPIITAAIFLIICSIRVNINLWRGAFATLSGLIIGSVIACIIAPPLHPQPFNYATFIGDFTIRNVQLFSFLCILTCDMIGFSKDISFIMGMVGGSLICILLALICLKGSFTVRNIPFFSGLRKPTDLQ